VGRLLNVRRVEELAVSVNSSCRSARQPACLASPRQLATTVPLAKSHSRTRSPAVAKPLAVWRNRQAPQRSFRFANGSARSAPVAKSQKRTVWHRPGNATTVRHDATAVKVPAPVEPRLLSLAANAPKATRRPRNPSSDHGARRAKRSLGPSMLSFARGPIDASRA